MVNLISVIIIISHYYLFIALVKKMGTLIWLGCQISEEEKERERNQGLLLLSISSLSIRYAFAAKFLIEQNETIICMWLILYTFEKPENHGVAQKSCSYTDQKMVHLIKGIIWKGRASKEGSLFSDCHDHDVSSFDLEHFLFSTKTFSSQQFFHLVIIYLFVPRHIFRLQFSSFFFFSAFRSLSRPQVFLYQLKGRATLMVFVVLKLAQYGLLIMLLA